MSDQLARSTAYSHADFSSAKTCFHFWLAVSIRSGHQSSTSCPRGSEIEPGLSWRANHAFGPPSSCIWWKVREQNPNDIRFIIWRANADGIGVAE